ncbi:hypothetical protein E6W39_12655 [Kitasatospora acidiphila]|uniref:Bulb-type lectin domain-containing protein n=1 Tax=Kitasatospora acidiphila TaxID=2567942 RepID=A0A540W1S6_9ACTN|nr:hypothetical protein [Kitasatospora acidiphila]TQF02953.1 hypothetical protein E6W39_12655 [Kitasatospora acidiphila]
MKSMRKATKVLIAGAAAVAAVVGLSGTASANTTNALSRGQSLYPGDSIINYYDSNIKFELTLQTDGNLVEYHEQLNLNTGNWDRYPCWATGTNGSGATNATYQSDGNFVLYNGNSALWASNTQWKAGSTVDINTSGAIYVGVTKVIDQCQP